MKKRSRILITILVAIPIFCIIILLIGIFFNNIKLAIRIVLAIAILAIITKIILAIASAYKSYVHR